MRRTWLVFLLFMTASLGFSQHPKKAMKAYDKAQKAFVERDYEKAYKQLTKTLAADPKFAEAWLLQGELGMETRDAALALEGYQNALALDSMLFPPAALNLAELYDHDLRYAEEIALLQWFLRVAPGNQANDEKATKMLKNARFRKEAFEHPVAFHPQSLGPGVNTANDEYVNALELTATELLFTRRFSAEDQKLQDEGLFVTRFVDGGWCIDASQILVDPEMDNHVGAAFVSYKGDELFFTVCGMDRRNQSCDLFVACREGREGAWSHPQPLGNGVNDPAWDSQPCLSLDGKELFFASRRNGNADLYHCYRDDEGHWSEPENLGPVINTPGTEMAPFLHPDGKTLYFSSNTHVGMGGFDLFVSRRNEEGEWSEPVNLGYPINTPGDEINFIVAADGHTAFISSFRVYGSGGYDIYTFQLEEEIVKSEPVNVYNFLIEELKPGAVVQLVNIQFEYNSASLTETSQEGILMLADFLRMHDDLHVELGGHTDNKGTEAYNLTLSEQRAEVVRKALVDHGIDEGRLSAKGYGASQPIWPNDNEEHRAMNRRTEMKVIER